MNAGILTISNELRQRQLNSLLTAAVGYSSMGWSVIPTNGKIATISWLPFQEKPPSLEEIATWFKDSNPTGLAIVTGAVSSLVVLDFDDPKLYDTFIRQHQHLSQTRTVKTKRGFHLYYHLPTQLRLNSRSVPGIDLQANGKYVVAPPTRIGDHTYTVLKGDAPKTLTADDIATITNFLDQQRCCTGTETLSNSNSGATIPQNPIRTGKQHSERADKQSKGIHPADLAALYRFASTESGRNNTLFKLACLGRDNGLSQDQVTKALADIHTDQQTNSEHHSETMWQRHREATRTIQSAFSRPARERLHRYKEPEQLPNPIREALFAEKLTCVVRVIEGLRLNGIQPNQAITKKLAVNLLRSIVGRDSVYNALNAVLENGQTVFETTQNPSPRTPQPPAYGVAKLTGQSHNCKCLQLNPPKSGIVRKTTSIPTVFIMPSNLELAEKLGVRHSTISDELTLDDLKSAKSTREACHAGLIQRRPGQYTVKFFANRVGMSERTINRYNAADENIHSKPMYHDQPVFWNNIEAVIPAEIEYFPHEGVFLTDSTGKKYPPKREIARRLLSKKQFVTLRTRLANYWYYGDVQMPVRFQADMNAILDEMAQRTARHNRTYTPQYEFPVITPVVAEASTKMPQYSAKTQMSYRQPLQYDEDFARYAYRTINEMDGEGQISLESARRLVYKYGEKAIRRAMDVANSRRNITKPVGFISTHLRSEARGG
jgi:hypothetical protein